MTTISIIRERGQLTIPDSIRKKVNWVRSQSPVAITVAKSDEIVIKPYQKQVNWEKIWEGIRRARAIKGRRGNLSKFIAEDRYGH